MWQPAPKSENAHFKTSLFELIPYDKEFEKKTKCMGIMVASHEIKGSGCYQIIR
ncbi:Uncharacterised protein [Sphingobacterium daejeonense]|nr:Uncharacterised protein [Sphingobacterium daejeonense]